MKPNQIEPGMFLKGHQGQIREVVKIELNGRLQFRQIAQGSSKAARSVGSIGWMDLVSMAKRAERECDELGVAV
jgi:hypothetical protein